jgi:hydroxypyruvate isomerase
MLASVHLDYILGTLPLAERFPAARKLGFNAVELPFPYATPARDYARLLTANGLAQISIGAPTSDYKAGEPGYAVTPGLKPQFDRSIRSVIDYAREIGCPNVHVFAGARAPDVPASVAFDSYCRNLAEAHDLLQAEGLRLVIEPVNSTDFRGYFLDRLDMALAAIARAGRSRIGIILDLYHAHVNREDAAAVLRQHTDAIAHIQLADFPGRHEPGTGEVDFAAFFRTLREVGYAGSVGLEYVPTRPIADGVPLAELLPLDPPPRCRAETAG